MRLRLFTFLCWGLLLGGLPLRAQQIQNGSFEGALGASLSPPGWEPCFSGSTPDTQPGSWGVATEPAGGSAYLSLICRGAGVPFPNRWEAVQQALATPLKAGVCHKYTIDLAHTASFHAGGMYFDQPACLRFWGAAGPCEPAELLWTSKPVAHPEWRRYHVTLLPLHDYPYLLIEAYYASEQPYSGNLLLDNLVYYPEIDPCMATARQD